MPERTPEPLENDDVCLCGSTHIAGEWVDHIIVTEGDILNMACGA